MCIFYWFPYTGGNVYFFFSFFSGQLLHPDAPGESGLEQEQADGAPSGLWPAGEPAAPGPAGQPADHAARVLQPPQQAEVAGPEGQPTGHWPEEECWGLPGWEAVPRMRTKGNAATHNE